MRALGLVVIIMAVLAGACGSSNGTTQPSATNTSSLTRPTLATPEEGAQPPHVLSVLPEGKLLVQGSFGAGGTLERRPTYVIAGEETTLLAATEVAGATVSVDKRYLFYAEPSSDWKLPPTALVVLRTDGVEVFRRPLSSPNLGSVIWAPQDDRLAFQIGGVIYIRDVHVGGAEVQFDAPQDASLASWIGGGSQMLLAKMPGIPAGNSTFQLYLLDAASGRTVEFDPPRGANLGGAGAGPSFSPDGKYLTYATGGNPPGICYSQCDLWLQEIASGRTCLIMKDAPAHQYPQIPGWSPDSKWLTYHAKRDPARGYTDLHVVRAEDCFDQGFDIADTRGGIWSPDGSALAIEAFEESTHMAHTVVWHVGAGLISTGLESWGTWSPDGTKLGGTVEDRLQVAGPKTGTMREYEVPEFSPRESPRMLWSPSGRYLLVYGFQYAVPTARPGETVPTEKPFLLTPSLGHGRMYVVDTTTASVTKLVDEPREFEPIAWLP